MKTTLQVNKISIDLIAEDEDYVKEVGTDAITPKTRLVPANLEKHHATPQLCIRPVMHYLQTRLVRTEPMLSHTGL